MAHKIHFEDEAELYAVKAWSTLNLEAPVDLHRVAKKLKIEIHEREFVEAIDGIYLRLPGAPPVIGINTSHKKPFTRRRFTLAHEIGHHLLGKHISPGKQLFFFDSGKSPKGIIERACDRFASMLLMPTHLVRKFYDELEYNQSNRVSIMANRFEVSTWAMRRRLRELGLETNPYRLR